MSQAFFDQVEDALIGFLTPELRRFSSRRSARNLKVWWGTEPREHYEVQLLGSRRGARSGETVLEVGFHVEYPHATRSDEVLRALRALEDSWRPTLGPEAEAGPFLGRQGPWRRVSEVWEDAGPIGPEAAVEAAERLASYITTLEPLRRAATPGSADR